MLASYVSVAVDLLFDGLVVKSRKKPFLLDCNLATLLMFNNGAHFMQLMEISKYRVNWHFIQIWDWKHVLVMQSFVPMDFYFTGIF